MRGNNRKAQNKLHELNNKKAQNKLHELDEKWTIR